MRIAAIDIGTNSVHMIVVQVRPDQSFEIIDREKEMVRLGAGGLGGRALTEQTMRAALLALGKFRRLAESHDVDEIVAAATSAVREPGADDHLLKITPAGDTELELWAAERSVAPLEAALGRVIRFEVDGQHRPVSGLTPSRGRRQPRQAVTTERGRTTPTTRRRLATSRRTS